MNTILARIDMDQLIYLDHQSTTPVDPRVLEKMLPYFSNVFGNAASKDHVYGLEAKRAVDRARQQVASLIGANDDEIIFTSGATEANNLALFGIMEEYAHKGDHLITVRTEHKAILDTAKELERRGKRVTYLEVDQFGCVSLDALKQAIKPETVLVSIMAANNEIGTLAPLAEIGEICASADIFFHTDAVQLAGHLPLNVNKLGIHLASLSAHKMYGPKGIGVLYRKRSNPRIELHPIIWGGGHERGLRSGTLNVPGIVGFGEAAQVAKAEMQSESKLHRKWVDKIFVELTKRLDGVELNGHPELRLPNNLNLSIDRIESRALIVEMKNTAIATGSACTSHSVEPSHVIQALGLGDRRAHEAIRISVGRTNNDEQIDEFIESLTVAVENLRTFADF